MKMAKTTYKQTTKGDIRGAKDLSKAARNLQKFVNINKEKLDNLKVQYQSSSQAIAERLQRDTGVLLSGFEEAGANYGRLAKDNDAAESDNSFSNLANMRRERAQSLEQVLAQGGGETDLLKAQGIALRNMGANQMDTNRSFADTLTSINNNISDANVQTRSSLAQTAEESDLAQRQAWNELQSGSGSVLGEQVDLLGQIGNLYGQGANAARTVTAKTVTTGKKNQKTTQSQGSKETKLSKTYTKRQDQANKDSVKTVQQLADLNKQTYTSQLQTPEQLGFTELNKKQGVQNMNEQSNAQTLTQMKGPEGATLRKW